MMEPPSPVSPSGHMPHGGGPFSQHFAPTLSTMTTSSLSASLYSRRIPNTHLTLQVVFSPSPNCPTFTAAMAEAAGRQPPLPPPSPAPTVSSSVTNASVSTVDSARLSGTAHSSSSLQKRLQSTKLKRKRKRVRFKEEPIVIGYADSQYKRFQSTVTQPAPGVLYVVCCDQCGHRTPNRWYHCQQCSDFDLCTACYREYERRSVGVQHTAPAAGGGDVDRAKRRCTETSKSPPHPVPPFSATLPPTASPTASSTASSNASFSSSSSLSLSHSSSSSSSSSAVCSSPSPACGSSSASSASSSAVASAGTPVEMPLHEGGTHTFEFVSDEDDESLSTEFAHCPKPVKPNS